MTLPVDWHPRARGDLLALYDWIADRADPDTALAYTARIEDKCATLADFPRRGTPRDDLAPGLRTVTYRRRVVIAYRVERDRVIVFRLIHAARDFDAVFDDDD